MAHHGLKLKTLSLAVIAASAQQISFAENDAENAMHLSPVVVTATRIEQNSFDLPVAIDVVTKKDIQDGQLQMTLSESLIRVPGVTTQNRTQQAQDPQISSRGFGSRASFGVRGIRIYLDGIPLTMPDGQGQPGIVDLSAIRSVEVMRGPFSALYGNTSGGVIQMLTENAPETPEVGGSIMFGSYNTKREILKASGTSENLEYLLNISDFSSDGYRDHSASDKQSATAKFKFNISDYTKLTTLVNWFQQDAKDPNGLTKADVKADRKGVVPAVTNADLKVSRSHAQVGFNLEHQLNETNALNLITYVGTRNNAQIITTTPLARNLIGGCFPPGPAQGTCARLSEIDREFYGADLRWDNKGYVFNKAYNISFGLNYGKSTDARLDTNLLTNGLPTNTLNRREDNIVFNFDQYVQGKLAILDKVDLHAGLRHTRVNLKVKDELLPPDNSGAVTYEKTNPVIGAVWKVNPSFNLYANYGKGFETPTFFEASFNSTANTATPNLNLKPSESQNLEIGAKAFVTDNTQVNLTAFNIQTKNELVVNNNNSGRTVYANANDTSRTGLELSVDSEFDNNISTYLSYSLLNAKFDSAYVGNAGLIASGNRIPGTYKTQLYGEVAWKYPALGFKTALEARHNSKVYVDDINSDTASSYTVFNLRAGFEQQFARWHFKEYVRVENLSDKEYIGSVRINDGNKLFYEPAAGRNYLLGLSANYKF